LDIITLKSDHFLKRTASGKLSGKENLEMQECLVTDDYGTPFLTWTSFVLINLFCPNS
jgi:hypothetical protein